MALQSVLDCEDLPKRLECFDISHAGGEATVASCVVFDTDGPLKSDYRRFNIEGVTRGDDYGAMEQAIRRRYTRLAQGEGVLPDVLVIDGGAGQVNRAREVLDELKVEDLAVVGIAKGPTRKAGAGDHHRGRTRGVGACRRTGRPCTSCSRSATRRTGSPSQGIGGGAGNGNGAPCWTTFRASDPAASGSCWRTSARWLPSRGPARRRYRRFRGLAVNWQPKSTGRCMAISPISLSSLTLPNIITIARIALVPVFALVYIVTDSYYWVAALLFATAAFTDWLDGYLARRMGQTTRFGEFLDPVADKLIVVTALVLLIGSYGSLWMTLPGVIIIGREIVISALREWMAEMNRRGLVSVSGIGRLKTAVQMVATIVLLANPPPVPWRPWSILGLVLLYVAGALTIWSMVTYSRAAWPTLRDGLHEGGR